MKVRRSRLAQVGSRTMVPTLITVSLYLLVVGHDAPGGGFVGGLLAGTALLVAFLSGGAAEARRLLPVRSEVLVGLGVAIAVSTALAGLVLGDAFLDVGKLQLELGPLGDISIGAALVFDVGVFLVVVGLVSAVISELGDPEETQA